MNKIKVTEQDFGQRLDKFLNTALPDITRSQIKKMIQAGDVTVNKKNVTVHHFLKQGEIIEIKKNQIKTKTSSTTTKKSDSGLKFFKKIKIINEQEDYLIIDKPAGLLVHPTEKGETDTLIDWLIDKYPAIKKIGEDPDRPGIVHRLDKEVSGLMIIPKNQNAFDYFKTQFKEHIITKKYVALSYGEINKDADEIRFPIGRSTTKSGLFAAHPQIKGDSFNDKDKKAITIFKVTQQFKNYTLLEIEIMTGRTHQIRVHLLAYSHPIVGDKLYKNRKIKINKDIDRIFLHAHQLSFMDMDNNPQTFNSPLPLKLKNFLKLLRTI